MKKIAKEKLFIVVGIALMIFSITFLLFKVNVFKTNTSDYEREKFGALASAKVTITFNPKNGTVSPKSATIKSGTNIETLPTPKRDGFIFVGWYTELNGGSKVTTSTKFSKSTTIYAHWKKETSSPIAVTSLRIDPNNIKMDVGKNINLKSRLTIEPGNATNQTITWTSSNASVATVNENGYVSARTAGTVTITAKAHNGKTATCKITVIKPATPVTTYKVTLNPNGGSVSPTSLSVVAGKKIGSLPTPTRSGYTFKGWYTKATDGTKVSSDTIVNSNMTIYAQWNKTSTTVAVTKVTLSKTSLSLKVKGTDTLKATIIPSNATNKTITWSSNNTKIATVDKNGKVTAVSKGTATITAKAHNGVAATCKVTVTNSGTPTTTYKVTLNPNGGSVSPTSLSVVAGQKVGKLPTPTRSGYTFKGWFTKQSGGDKVTSSTVIKSNITIYAQWNKTSTTVVVTSITLDKNSLNLKEKETYTLKVTIIPSSATDKTITWSSSNTSVATIDKNGKVTGVKAGTATITAKSNNGKTATCKVTVTKQSGQTIPPTQSGKSIEIMNSAANDYKKNIKEKIITDPEKEKAYIEDIYTKHNCSKNTCWWPNNSITTLTGEIKVYDQNNNYLLKIDSSKLANVLIPGNSYYLKNGNTTEHIIVNKNAYRMIKVDGIPNIRDLGGMSASGGTIKYGLLYRGSNPNRNGSVAASVFKQIGINMIVDLRRDDTAELKAKKQKEDISPLKDNKITKVTKGVNSYPSSQSTGNKSGDQLNRIAVRYIMERIVNGNKIYYHCAVGKDRTGTVSYLIGAILGADSNSLLKDYSLSYLSYPKGGDSLHYDKFNNLVNYINKTYKGDNLEAKAINWLLYESKDKNADINLVNKFRSKMIDGSPTSYKLDSNGNAVKSSSGTPTPTPPSTTSSCNSKNQKIHFIKQDGAGDAILLESDCHFAMVDVGVPHSDTKKSDDVRCSKVINYVKARMKEAKVNSLDFIILTHAHNDHIGCGVSILNNIKVNSIYLKRAFKDQLGLSGAKNKIVNDIVDKANEKKIAINYVDTKSDSDDYVMKLSLGKMSLRLYNTKQRLDEAPWNTAEGNGFYDNENNNSIVTLVTVNNKKALLTGDLEDYNVMKKIVAKTGNVNILKLPHHGKGIYNELQLGLCGLAIYNINGKIKETLVGTGQGKLNPTYLVSTSGEDVYKGKCSRDLKNCNGEKNTKENLNLEGYFCFTKAGFTDSNYSKKTYTPGANLFAVQSDKVKSAVVFDIAANGTITPSGYKNINGGINNVNLNKIYNFLGL